MDLVAMLSTDVLPYVICHLSCFMCHIKGVACNMSCVTCHFIFLKDKVLTNFTTSINLYFLHNFLKKNLKTFITIAHNKTILTDPVLKTLSGQPYLLLRKYFLVMLVWSFMFTFSFLVRAEFQVNENNGNVSCAKILQWTYH